MTATSTTKRGRRPSTDHASIERAAFALFEKQGFEDTTMEQIAEAVGVGRRTLFRYYPSKSDVPWGEFAKSIDQFRQILASMPTDISIREAVHRGVLQFNQFDPEAYPLHRQRMKLILTTPALQAHSVLQYAEWRQVVAEFVASRRGVPVDSSLPNAVGHFSLAIAISAYEQWLEAPQNPLSDAIDEGFEALTEFAAWD